MNLTLNFAKEKISLEIPDKNVQQILLPNKVNIGLTDDNEIEQALDNPLERGTLEEVINPNDSVAIISDITRSETNKIILPQLLCRLFLAGVKTENITIVFARSSQQEHTEADKINMVGPDIFDTYKCVNSGSEGYISMGVSSPCTPVEICRFVAQADKRICVSDIEHNCYGYSGSAKAVMAGVTTCMAGQTKQGHLTGSTACAGNSDCNSIQTDIDGVLKYCPVDFVVNVILDEEKQIIKAFAGDCIEAHRAGCEFLDTVYEIEICEKADIVLASAGSWPENINCYQAQKALSNAGRAVSPGGTIILLASCKEGFSEDLSGECKTAAAVLAREDVEVFLVSELDAKLVQALRMKPHTVTGRGAAVLEEAFAKALEKHGEDASVIVMPYGGLTLPKLIEQN